MMAVTAELNNTEKATIIHWRVDKAGEKLIKMLNVMKSEKSNRIVKPAIVIEVAEANAVVSEDQTSASIAIFKFL